MPGSLMGRHPGDSKGRPDRFSETCQVLWHRLEPEIGPPQEEHCNQKRQVDKDGDCPLVIQPVQASIPEKNEDSRRKCGRPYGQGAPPGLPREYAYAASHQAGGRYDTSNARQPPCRSIAKKP